jgi:tetratricopeptide (TPR) repeat protein
MVLMVKRHINCAIILSCFCLVNCSASLSQHTLRDFELGKEALNKQNYDEAIGYFKSYIENAPQNGDAHLQLGIALLKSGSLREAVDEFKQSINLNPESKNARTLIKESIFNEANTFFNEGKNDIGIRYLLAHANINPDDIDTHIILTKELIEIGATRSALNSLKNAVALDPKNPEVIELLDYFADGLH